MYVLDIVCVKLVYCALIYTYTAYFVIKIMTWLVPSFLFCIYRTHPDTVWMQTWPLPELDQELDSLVDSSPWGSLGGYWPLMSFQVSDPGKKSYNKLKKQIKI